MSRLEHVRVDVGGQIVAIAAERVREVVANPVVASVPLAPDGVVGVLALRGDVLCVLDPAPWLGLPSRTQPAQAVLVARAAGRWLALAVDDVLDVVALDAAALGRATGGTGPTLPLEVDGQLHQVVDLDRIGRAGRIDEETTHPTQETP